MLYRGLYELLKEEYLEGLRSGKDYNTYKHGMMYQMVTSDQLTPINYLRQQSLGFQVHIHLS